MNKKMYLLTLFVGLFTLSNLHANDLLDEDLEELMNMKSEVKADVGSRNGAQNFLDSLSPVDVITYDKIENTGLTSLTDVLRYFVAGFNAPETSVADGSDHIRAFTLRGMAPDQVLVLINGKRLHTSSLLHVNSTIGRGSSNADLDTIALKSIQRIEILRDGAAAQYGSDAISGVINIILKGAGHKNSIGVHYGQRSKQDGDKLYADAFITKPLRYDGFINLTLSAQDQDKTQRAGLDSRLSTPSVQTHAGIPASKNYNFVLNTEIPQESDITIYSNAVFNYRDSEASAFFRPSDHDPATSLLYPNGFLPMINAKITDYSLVLGVSGEFIKGISWDLSNTYGYNNIDYYVNNSMNYSLGAASPTSFYNGSLTFLQNTTNFDVKKSIGDLNIATGLEYRYENYKINAGDTSSYTGTASQGFAGYRPENETDSSRNSYALYLDMVYHLYENLSFEGAFRHENYNDFGSTSNVKFSAGYKPVENVLLRTSVSTGFRAPSLAQSFYSQTSSYVSGGSLITQGTFTPDSEVSKAFGAKELKPEKSKHLTIGSVYQPNKNSSFMFDYFYTKVEDRIMLSDDMSATTAAQTAILAANGVGKARFFTNAVDTTTEGFDLKFNHKFEFENNSKLDFSIWYNYALNKISSFNDSTITREGSYEQVDRVENGQPKTALRILNRYELDDLTTTLNINRYGSYRQVISNIAYEFEPAWTADIDVAYKINKSINVAIGSINLFDTYPNKWDGLSGTFYGYDGIKPYSRYSPFGYSGAYYYVRANIKF